MPALTYRLRGKVWTYEGGAAGGWHFVTLPKGPAKEIRMLLGGATGRGWGSVRVSATIGATTWQTSIFPDKKAGSFLLPLKAEVRQAEGIGAGDTIDFVLEIG
ncbi:MAG TPA: DUF1905 domain-containing protein [Candidatus Thermoplasmatota archaeon]|nr:DUF1905 domain-containing protein [Candidatus Thermoplasmatota archaeon]